MAITVDVTPNNTTVSPEESVTTTLDITTSIPTISAFRPLINATNAGGDGSLAYDNSSGVFTYTGPSATEARAHFSAGTGVSYSSGQFSIGQDVATNATPTFTSTTVAQSNIVNGATAFLSLYNTKNQASGLTEQSTEFTGVIPFYGVAIDTDNSDAEAYRPSGRISSKFTDCTESALSGQMFFEVAKAGATHWSMANPNPKNVMVLEPGTVTIGVAGYDNALDLTDLVVHGSLDINGNADISGNLTGIDTLTATNLVGTLATANRNEIFSNVSGDITIAAGGAATIQATSVENSMLAGSITNAKLSNSTITVSDGSNTSPVALGGTLTFAGTSNEVTVAENAGTVTIGLPDDVTIAGDLSVADAPTAGAHVTNKTYVDAKVAALVDSAPEALDTLKELATALGDDANYATTTASSIGEKLAKASNLSDLTNAGTARTNLGLGTAATTDATAYATAAQGTKADSAIQSGDLATVATSGSYADLTNKPTLGTAAATASSDYAPAAGSSNILATGALDAGSITSGFTSIDIGSGALTAGATTVNGALTVNSDLLKVVSTAAGAAENPILSLYRNKSSIALTDEIGAIEFSGNGADGAEHIYSRIYSELSVITEGAEQANLRFALSRNNGIEDPTMVLRHYGLELMPGNNLYLQGSNHLEYKGQSIPNDVSSPYDTKLNITNPTADRTISLPDASGTVALTTDNVSSATLASTVTVANSTTNTDFPVVFHDESNGLLDDTGALTYNPSTGALVSSGTISAYVSTADAAQLRAGREDGQDISIFCSDAINSIVADQDTDLNSDQQFVLNRTFNGNVDQSSNNSYFKIQNNGSTELEIKGGWNDNSVSETTLNTTLTVNGALTVNSDLFELTSTVDNATEKPIISLYRDAGVPSANDELGAIRWFGQNASDEKQFYGGIYAQADVITDGAHKGSLNFHLADGSNNGTAISDVLVDINGDEDPTMSLTSELLTVNGDLAVSGGITSDSFTYSRAVTIQAGDLTATAFKALAGKRIVKNNSVAASSTFTLFQPTAADVGKSWIICNASTYNITIDPDTQNVWILDGVTLSANESSWYIKKGGVAELVCIDSHADGGQSSAPTFIIFGAGIIEQ